MLYLIVRHFISTNEEIVKFHRMIQSRFFEEQLYCLLSLKIGKFPSVFPPEAPIFSVHFFCRLITDLSISIPYWNCNKKGVRALI